MAKAKSLLESARNLPQARTTGPVPWSVRFAVENPKLLAEINELVDAHLDGDESLRLRLPTMNTLVEYLIAECGIGVKKTTLRSYVNQRRADRGKKTG